MKVIPALVLFFLTGRIIDGADKAVKNRVIYELTDKNLDIAIKKNYFVVICFYSGKSRTSRDFDQTYIEVAQEVRRENKFIHFARIDVTRFPKVERDYKISELPTLKFFKNGRHYDFIGDKTVKHITTWTHMALNLPYTLDSGAGLDQLRKFGTVILGCFPDAKPKDEYEKFLNASFWFVSAKYIPLPMFALIENEEAMYECGVDKGSVTVLKNFDDGERVTYKGSVTDSDRLLRFCEDESQPVVFPYGKKEYSMKLSMGDVKYQHILFMDPKASNFKNSYNSFKIAAKSFMSTPDDVQVLFIHVDPTQKGIEKVRSFFHIDIYRDVPCNRMTKLDDYHSRYAPSQNDFTKSGFESFTRRVLQGSIRRTTRSEPLPSDWNKYPLKVLVGSNYERITRERGKTVFVMYQIPDNEECRKVLPVIDDVSMRYNGNNSVVIATMDVSKNDGEIDVHFEFPSFKLFTADNKVLKFTGTRTVDAIQAFINSNGVIHTGASEVKAKPKSIYEYGDGKYQFYQNPDALDYESMEEIQETMLPLGKHNLQNETNRVFDITDEGLDGIIKYADFYVVCFYSEKSRKSAEFQQTYFDVVVEVHKTNPYIRFARIDIDKYRHVEIKHKIDEIPMIKFYKNGRHYDYRGIPGAANITNFVHHAMNLPAIVSSSSEFELMKKDGTVIVGCFPGDAPATEYNKFLNASAWFVSGKNLPLPLFALVNTARLMRELGFAKGSVSIIKSFEKGAKTVYGGSLQDSDKLLKFCEEESQPIVFPHGQKEFSYILTRRDTKLQHLLFMDPNDYNFKSTFNSFKEAAKKFRKSQSDIDVLFIHVDTTKKDIENVVAFFHVDIKKDVPCNRIAKPDEFHSRYVPPKKDLTEKGFTDFTNQVLEGKISKTVRSADLPSDWDKYTLKILVGKNYEEVTRKKGHTVFVMYYVTNVDQCKRAMPVMEEVAMRYRGNSTVTIATMDISQNDGEIDVFQDVPTFKMFTAENKVFRFNGTRTAQAIQDFINTNGESETDDKAGEEAVFSFQKVPEDDRNPEELRYEDAEKREKMWTEDEFKSMESAMDGSKDLHDTIEGEHPHKGVYELTDKIFEKVIQEIAFLVVCFYSTESRASVQFENLYHEVASSLHQENKHFCFARIDIGKYKDIEKKHALKELPMLRFYKHGRHFDFMGEKTTNHIKTFVHMAMNTPFLISSKAEYEEIKKEGTVVVGCFPEKQPKDQFLKFLNASAFYLPARYLPSPVFMMISTTALMQEIGLKRSSVTVFKKFERGASVEYDGSILDSDKLLNWLEVESVPVVYPYGDNEYSFRLSQGNVKMFHILFMDPKAPFFKETFRNFKAASKSFRKDRENIDVLYAHADPSDPVIDKLLAFFHVERRSLPCNRIAKTDRFHSRFVPSRRDFSRQGFVDFTNDVTNGRIPRTLLSEQLPEDWDKYPLKIIVGSNYEQVTTLKGQTVFVMFYVPDNPECERVFPVMDELAMRYRDNKTVTIAVMDVSKNDADIDVHMEYPSFRLFTSDNKVKALKGEKSLRTMKAFIDANGAPNFMDFDPFSRGKGGYEYEEQGYGSYEDPFQLNYGARDQNERRWSETDSKIEEAVKDIEGRRTSDNPGYAAGKNVDDDWNLEAAKYANLDETPTYDSPSSGYRHGSSSYQSRNSDYHRSSSRSHFDKRYHDEH